MEQVSVCHTCGACCATYRVSFYWGEADDAPDGWVPAALTQQLTPHLRCMRGTSTESPRCEQLQGDIPGAICRIYPQRPSPCRELEPYDIEGKVSPQCARARARHGLAPLPELPPVLMPPQIVLAQPLSEVLLVEHQAVLAEAPMMVADPLPDMTELNQ